MARRRILWRSRPLGGALGKLSSLWDDGVFLSVRGISGEIIVRNRSGAWETRTIQRRPLEERLEASTVELVTGVPWRTSDENPDVDGEKMETIKLTDREVATERYVLHENVPREFRIELKDFEASLRTKMAARCQSSIRCWNLPSE